jgi:hypothetical protein
MTVRLGIRHRLQTDETGSSRPVFHYERLSQVLGHVIGEESRDNVHQISGRKWNDDFDWPRVLRLREGIIVWSGGENEEQEPHTPHPAKYHRYLLILA